MRIIRRTTGTGSTGPHLAFTTQPDVSPAGVQMDTQPVVTLVGDGGATVTGFNGAVTVAMGNNPDGAVLSGTTTRDAVNGVATFTDLQIDRDGTGLTLKASAVGLADAFSAAFDIATPPVSFWWNTSFDRRLVVPVTNDTGNDLRSHVLSITMPAGVSPDANSLRAVEIGATGAVDRAYDWRNGRLIPTNADRFVDLPVSISAGVATVKTIGKWPNGETRRFALYWKNGGGIAAKSYAYLAPAPKVWTVTVVNAVSGNTYRLNIAGQQYSVVAGGADTTSTIATALRAAINGGAVATAGGSTNSVTVTSSSTAALDLTNTGTTVLTDLTIAKPAVWTTYRAGPDTESQALNSVFYHGWPYGFPNTGIATQSIMGRGTSEGIRLSRFRRNADSTNYGVIDGSVDSYSDKGSHLAVAGTLTFAAASGGPDWQGSYSASHRHRFYVGRKSSDVPFALSVTRGSTGDVYRVVVNGTPLSYTQQSGDADASAVAAGLAAAINAGTVAKAIATAGAISLFPVTNTATVANTGTTTPANLTVTPAATADSLLKWVDVIRCQLTLTCIHAYTPGSIPSNQTASSNNEILALAATNNTFTSNVTEHADNKVSSFSATGRHSIASVAASADLSGLAVTGTVVGHSGNSMGQGILVKSCTLSNFGTQAPEVKWSASSNPFFQLQLRNLSNGSTIPVGAQIVCDFWFVSAKTNDATTVGNNLLPDEIVDLLLTLDAAPTQTVPLEADVLYSASQELVSTMAQAATDAVAGQTWIQSNALARTGTAYNYGFQWDTRFGANIDVCDDDDSNYGQAHALHGLCLRYLRTHDVTLIPLIENQVIWHLNIEKLLRDQLTAIGATAAAAYYVGSAPYFIWASPTPSSGYTAEGGISSGSTNLVDPDMPGGIKGTINYTQGQVRRLTSIDQMHMVAHAMYAYLYLLRNESLITGTSTTFNGTNLRTAALAYLANMVTFEAAHWQSKDRFIDNLYNVVTGTGATHANGINDTELNDEGATALANPYWGNQYGPWNVSNTDNQNIQSSANLALDYFFRAMFAPGSTVAGVKRFLQGQSADMVGQSLGHHEVTATTASWGTLPVTAGVSGYPKGWQGRSNSTGNNFRYNSGHSPDKHWIEIGSGGWRDNNFGRIPQRMIVLCLTAMLDSTYSVPVENNGATVLRSTPILTAIDDLARVMANYQIDPTTKAVRYASPGALGGGLVSTRSERIDSAHHGYWLMAVEMWHLLQDILAGDATFSQYYNPRGLSGF